MNMICFDLEGVLVPEIWIAFSEVSGIPELRRTTRDEPDYTKLMNWRIGILHEHHLGLNEITFVINALVVVASAFVFGINIALYAVIMTYVSMKAGDAIMYGFGDKIVQLDIIAGDPEALTKFIMDELGRGASSIEITGEYTGDRRKQIKILCSPRESFIIRRYLAQNDAKSFVTVTSIKSVWGSGRGFSDIHKVDD